MVVIISVNMLGSANRSGKVGEVTFPLGDNLSIITEMALRL